MTISPQASVRLTLATLLYSGKSPDGHHILVSAVRCGQNHQLGVDTFTLLSLLSLLSPFCVG